MDTLLAELSPDPRVGLAPGVDDAGQASWNMALVATRPKPEGFYDPLFPAGRAMSTERVPESGAIAGLWQGGDHGPGTQSTRETNQCHDITAYPEIGLAAGACSGNGILLDISDPINQENCVAHNGSLVPGP